MIESALVFIQKTLDLYLANRFKLEDSVTVINHLTNQDGSNPKNNQNKIVITLINLDYDTNKQYQDNKQRMADNGIAKINPPIQFNLDLLFTASFDNYQEALKFLNATIAFFQSHNPLNAKTFPGNFPEGIKTLNFEIVNSSFSEIHNLWSAMGAKYQPSIIYKVRHVTIHDQQIQSLGHAVTDVNATAQS